MIWVYLAAAIAGGAFVLPMLFAGLDFDADTDFELDADVGGDLDVGTDLEAAGGGLGELGDFLGALLSFRSIVFALFAFGVTGVVLTTMGTAAAGTVLAAIIVGLIGAVSNTWLMRWLRRTDSTSHLTMRDMQGAIGEVVIPLAPGRRGRIRTEIAGQTEYFTALPMKENSPELGIGEQVVVVEIENGAARVARLSELGNPET